MKKAAILLATLLVITVSCLSQVQTVSNHTKFKNGLSTDSIGGYTGDSLIIDGGDFLKFRDNIAGTIKLSAISDLQDSITKHTDTLQVHNTRLLTLEGAGINYGTTTQIPYMNPGGDDFSYDDDLIWDAAQVRFKVGGGSTTNDFSYYSRYGSLIYGNTTTYNQLSTYNNSTTVKANQIFVKYGGTIAAPVAAVTDTEIGASTYYLYDGTAAREAGEFLFKADGAIATDNFNTKYTWSLKEGASASAEKMSLDVDGLTIEDGLNITTLSNDDVETNLLAYDTGTGLVTYRSVASLPGGSSSYWSRTGTDLSPLNVGDDILIPSGDLIKFRSVSNFINSSTIGRLGITAGGNQAVEFTATAFNISVSGWVTTYGVGITNHSNHDGYLGSNSDYWSQLYVDTAYLYDDNTKLYRDGSSNLSFTDAVTGTKTLAELAASGTGDVTKVGTPVDNQIGVWTGDGTIEGDVGLTYAGGSGAQLSVTGHMIASGYIEGSNYSASGGNNTFVGMSISEPTGTYNTIVGNGSGNNTSVVSSVIIGSMAGNDLASTLAPIGIGNSSFDNATSPNYSIAIGDHAGDGADGDYCIYIGDEVGLNNDTDNQLYIDNSNTSTPLIHGDFGNDEITINGDFDVTGAVTGQRIMSVIEAQVLHTDTVQDTIIALPVNAVIWDIQVEVRTAFTGTGTDLLDIGVSTTGNRYEDDLNVAATGWPNMSLTNVPDRMTGTTNITFQYFDQNSDAGAGIAYIYIHYSLH